MLTVGAFAIILNKNDQILFCHRTDKDLWNLPGGKMELGESPDECVVREVQEETGLIVEIVHLSGVYSKPKQNEIVFSFFCKEFGGKLTLNDEADQFGYFSLDEIPQNTSKRQVERVKDFLKNKQKTYYKNQL